MLEPLGARFRVDGVAVELPVPGAHNVLNALAAIAACREAGLEPAEAAAALATFGGTGRRFEPRGRTAAGAEVYDDYAHHPTEVRATLEAARSLGADRVVACFQPHLFSRTRHLAREFGEALALADVVVVLEIYPSRERAEDHPGVSGRLVASAAADAAGGRPVFWAPRMDDAERAAADRAGAGRRPAHPRRGRRRRARRRARGRRAGRGPVSAPSPPAGVEHDFPLARLTTLRTGGSADNFARVHDGDTLAELLAWARAEGLAVGVVGSGSNLLVADAGVRGLVLKLEGELARIERDGERLRCGGGARLPQAAARAAREGMSGLEFGVNIPGTVGGAVRMNANAYGGDLSRVLEWAEVVSADGSERRAPSELGFAYRRSGLGRGGDRRPRLVRPRARRVRVGQGHPRRHALAPPRRAAVGDQDVRIDVQEPRGPARRGPERRPPARGGRVAAASSSGARASPTSTPTSSRTPARRPPPP